MEHKSVRLPAWAIVLIVTVVALAALMWYGAAVDPASAASAVEYAL